MKVIIHPSKVSGTVHAPASKSAMQRACALALMKNGNTYLKNPGKSNDDIAALNVIQKLGATVIKIDENNLQINSKIDRVAEQFLNCGESGLGLRMFAPLAALDSKEITITGSGSLLNRPMDFFDSVFPELGVYVKSNHGKLPIMVKGPLLPKNITIDGSLSSQFLTGLLIAFASTCSHPVKIGVTNLKSRPYIDLTLLLIKHFGWNVQHEQYKEFYFKPALKFNDSEITYTVEGDWSGGAFILVAGAISGQVRVKGLDINSPQADKKIIEALKAAGSHIIIEMDYIQVSSTILKCFNFDATDCPDLFPPLVVLASLCNGETNIKGVSRLKYKESDRGTTLREEFTKMGINIKIEGDIMKVTGRNKFNGGKVNSHHDHRIAMACSVAALRADSIVEISDAEAINKSYPDFYNDMKAIKTSLQII